MPRPGLDQPQNLTVAAVTPPYFATLGSRILRGRAFTDEDHRSAPPVAIVDQATASEEWPGEEGIGKCAFGRSPTDSTGCLTIVGIVESRRTVGSQNTGRDLLIPLAQAHDEQTPQLVFVRTKLSTSDPRPGIAAAARAAVPNAPFLDVRSFDDLADARTRSWRLGRTLFGWFGLVGVCLAALGLYAVLALAARQRTTEIGVRLALGARPVDVARLVLRHATTLVGAGWLLGLVAALASTRYLEALLFQVQPADPVTFAWASVVVLIAGVVGCLLPAARAAAVSPVKALRHEIQ
jgi:ABC-type lipoprotein release transport system permease subunit